VKRREFVAGLGGAVAWPVVVSAQPHSEGSKRPLIGILHPGRRATAFSITLILSALAERGYIDGQNITIEYRFAEGRYEQMAALAVNLMRLRPTVVIAMTETVGVPAALAADPQTPIVFASGLDPVQVGIMPRINRPGSNITGVVTSATNMSSRQLGILHELLHREETKIAALVNPANPGAIDVWAKNADTAARLLGIELLILNVTRAPEIERAFDELVRARAGALLVAPDPFLFGQSEQIVVLAARYRIPALYQETLSARAGGLMSYTSIPDDLYRTVGFYVARILKGEKPADLPFQQPTRFQFVINLQTAHDLGLEVPETLLAQADEIIK
jgi:putative tryptophan/tyrosine transport system substrate-binding protein